MTTAPKDVGHVPLDMITNFPAPSSPVIALHAIRNLDA